MFIQYLRVSVYTLQSVRRNTHVGRFQIRTNQEACFGTWANITIIFRHHSSSFSKNSLMLQICGFWLKSGRSYPWKLLDLGSHELELVTNCLHFYTGNLKRFRNVSQDLKLFISITQGRVIPYYNSIFVPHQKPLSSK